MKSLCILLLSCAAFAQQPLKITGNFGCTQSASTAPDGTPMTRVTTNGHVDAANVSGKTIVAVVLKVEASCGNIARKHIYSHDWFYKPGMSPNDTTFVPVDFDEALDRDKVHFADGKYSVEQVFVQFSDGSSYGDSNAASTLFQQRALVYEWLKTLTSQPDDASLSAAIDAQDAHPAIKRHLQALRGQFGLLAVRTDIAERLKTANERFGTGKF